MNIIKDIRRCTFCADVLPFNPKPVFQLHKNARILLIGQAPGLHAHETGVPWNDLSGKRLREWLEMSEQDFYDPSYLAIVPMGMCYPGRGKSGDNPPRPECKTLWMDRVLSELKSVEKIILVGGYATEYFLGKNELSKHIQNHSKGHDPWIVLPHPSPRNNIWLAKNPWFERSTLPLIRKKLRKSKDQI
jgi:uracil-DNA glycosylase